MDMVRAYIKFMIMDPDMEGGAEMWDDPDGGLTKYGVSAIANPDLDIANLTLPQAIDVAYFRYYTKYNINLITPHMACLVLDWVYNAGPADIRAIQAAVKARPDGIIGEHTAGALNMLYLGGKLHALAYLTAARQKHYMNKRNFQYYANGWLKRINKCSLWIASYEDDNREDRWDY